MQRSLKNLCEIEASSRTKCKQAANHKSKKLSGTTASMCAVSVGRCTTQTAFPNFNLHARPAIKVSAIGHRLITSKIRKKQSCCILVNTATKTVFTHMHFRCWGKAIDHGLKIGLQQKKCYCSQESNNCHVLNTPAMHGSMQIKVTAPEANIGRSEH